MSVFFCARLSASSPFLGVSFLCFLGDAVLVASRLKLAARAFVLLRFCFFLSATFFLNQQKVRSEKQKFNVKICLNLPLAQSSWCNYIMQNSNRRAFQSYWLNHGNNLEFAQMLLRILASSRGSTWK